MLYSNELIALVKYCASQGFKVLVSKGPISYLFFTHTYIVSLSSFILPARPNFKDQEEKKESDTVTQVCLHTID